MNMLARTMPTVIKRSLSLTVKNPSISDTGDLLQSLVIEVHRQGSNFPSRSNRFSRCIIIHQNLNVVTRHYIYELFRLMFI